MRRTFSRNMSLICFGGTSATGLNELCDTDDKAIGDDDDVDGFRDAGEHSFTAEYAALGPGDVRITQHRHRSSDGECSPLGSGERRITQHRRRSAEERLRNQGLSIESLPTIGESTRKSHESLPKASELADESQGYLRDKLLKNDQSSHISSTADGASDVVGTSSFVVSVANLTKAMVGIGMLTLPRSFADSAVLPATCLLLFCGSLSALTFFILGYCAHMTGTRTLPQLWEATVGPSTTLLVEVVILVDTTLSCIAFALLIADYSAKSIGGLFPDLPDLILSRRFLLGSITFGVLLPLCLARRLSFLRFSSILGLGCTLYVFFYVVLDFMFTYHQIRARPSLVWLSAKPSGVLSSNGRFAVAFMAHFNAPAFYADLRDHRPSRFAAMVLSAYSAAFVIYGTFGICGYGRFGHVAPGNALVAYDLSRSVLLMWLGMVVCVTASFPLVFAALREALLRLMSRAIGINIDMWGFIGKASTILAVLVIAGLGAELHDLSVVVSLCGALSGTALAFVIPGTVMLSVKRRQTPLFIVLGWVLTIVGALLGIASLSAIVCRDILEVI